MSLAARIAQELGGAIRSGGGYVCCCPAHDDNPRKPSFSIKDDGKGGVIFNCFAGCTFKDMKAELEARNLLPKYKPKNSRYEGAKFYFYKDLVGNVLCRKVKMPDKKMWFEVPVGKDGWTVRPEGKKATLEGLSIPLYNLKAVAAADLIYLCEGEKDAETLIARNLCATTNHAGANSWAEHLTEQLKGKTVVIIPDNDEAGRTRVVKISKALHGSAREIRVFVPNDVPEHGDITDWINSGGDAAKILEKSVVVDKKRAPKRATREEYYDLFERTLAPRKCIFSRKLMHFEADEGIWNPAVNRLDAVKSDALVENETRKSKFAMNEIALHFLKFADTKPAELLVEIPEWDGEARIEAMAGLVKLRNSHEVSQESFTELLKEWCAKVFERLHDPMTQNRILILQGGQGVGKDTWISMLVDGLGQFAIPLTVLRDDKDTYLNIHRGLVMKISEFDKTAKAEVSTLKEIITTPNTNLRASYDVDAKLRLSRCSFISSANAESLLRDSTGNRRYLIFEVEKIEFAYVDWSEEKKKEWRMQCLAEMKELAAQKYRASAKSWAEMNFYIERETPSDPLDDLMEQFVHQMRKSLSMAGVRELSFSDPRMTDLIIEVSRQIGIRPRGVKLMLRKRGGTCSRVGTKRVWTFKVPQQEDANEESNGFHAPEQMELTSDYPPNDSDDAA